MTDDTRQARIVAAEQAIDDAIWRLMGTRMSISGENLYQQVATAAIDAADAVGRERVSQDAQAVIEETIRALEKIYAGQITMNNHSHRPWLLKRIEALRALLTAQPEPGTEGEQR